MFHLLFWRDATQRAESDLRHVQASVVCQFCGDEAVPGFKGGYLVRYGFSYRHGDPRACALVVTRKKALRLAKANPIQRLWMKFA